MDCTVYVGKTKVLMVTAQLICTFVFAYAKRFSYDAAQRL